MTQKNIQITEIRKPIRRSVIISYGIFFLFLVMVLAGIAYVFGSRLVYEQNKNRLRVVINHVEQHIDPDDLAECARTGKKSEKYDELQHFLNEAVDGMELEYLYIVIPSEDLMTNVISATSQAERDAGEQDMPLLETTDAYSKENLLRYLSFWNSDTIEFFEENSDYGRYYTGAKPLRDSSGKTFALICADVSFEIINGTIINHALSATLIIALVCAVFAVIMYWWVENNVSAPIMSLEKSFREYAGKSKEVKDLSQLDYVAPKINTGNEIEHLSNTITEMVGDMKQYAVDLLSAQVQIQKAETEKREAQRIAELQQSVTSLLANMPAATFSKDAKTGVFLACNQNFAEYAGKRSPEEVVGHTDFDFFDEEIARHFAEDDRVTMSMDEPYIFFEDVKDAAGKRRRFQTTKLKFIDEKGRLCLLGMAIDVTEMVAIRKENQQTRQAYERALDESVTYSNIVHALAVDYEYLYYVDLNSEDYVEYRTTQNNDGLIEERRGSDFFASSYDEAGNVLYAKDVEPFREAFTKEKIIAALDAQNSFNLTYRMNSENGPVYTNMKITRMGDNDSHIIIGINNVDAQMRQKEADERIKEERITYNRINALTGDYISIYTVDPKTDRYLQYSGSEEYDTLGTKKVGEKFFDDTIAKAQSTIYPEDLERFNSLFRKEKILSEIEKNGIFTMRYRLVLNGVPHYVNLKAALVEEKDEPQLIVGINDIDAHVKQELEYERNLSQARAKANVDALTGVRNKHAYVDYEEKLNKRIENGENVEFALLVFDVNNLKEVNDTYGHQTGDRYICDTAKIICDIFKHSPVFRIGGDEFVAIADGADYKETDKLLEQLKENNATPGAIVIAYGLARNEGDRNVAAVFARADALMYENKRMLKNQK